MTVDAAGKVISDSVEAYRRADRLEPFGFSGWIGREPHGIQPQDMGLVRDGVYAEQVATMFGELAASRSDSGPWLAVASFVNPHDILFQGMLWNQLLHLQDPDDTVPDIAAGAFAAGRLRRSPTVPGGLHEGLAADDLPAGGRPRLSASVLLPAQGRRPGDRPHPPGPRGLRHGRRHHRDVHLRPRRPDRRARRDDAEVVQRVRRDYPGAARGIRPGHRNPRRRHQHADEPRGSDPHGCSASPASTSSRRWPRSSSTHTEAQPLPGRDLSGLLTRIRRRGEPSEHRCTS